MKSDVRYIPINRSKPFNPATFIGAGWSVWRGPANGNGLKGEEERDPRSAVLTELDLNQVQLVTCLIKRGGREIAGEECIKRLRTDDDDLVRLDENAFKAFWDNWGQFLVWFKRLNGNIQFNIQFISFDGVVLRDPFGDRYTLCLYFNNDGSMGWDCGWLGGDRDANNLSAMLAIQN